MILNLQIRIQNIKYFYILKLHKFKQPPKHFPIHSIFTTKVTKYGDLDHKYPINYLNGIKEIICKYQHKENVIKQREIC